MTEKDSSSGISRRAVLRRGAFATGVATVGAASFTGTALASDCPRTPGYWANHNWCAVPVDSEEPDGASVAESLGLTCDGGTASGTYELGNTGVSMTMEGWQEFLLSPPRGDKAKILARHVLATTLNFQRRSPTDEDCVYKYVDLSAYGLGTTHVGHVAAAARRWLREAEFDPEQTGDSRNGNGNGNDGDAKQRRWQPPTVSLETEDGSMTVGGEPLKDALDAFNNGNIDALDCNCDGSE